MNSTTIKETINRNDGSAIKVRKGKTEKKNKIMTIKKVILIYHWKKLLTFQIEIDYLVTNLTILSLEMFWD